MQSLNQSLFNSIYGLAHKSFFLDSVGVFFGNYFAYFLAIGAVIILVYSDDWRMRILRLVEAGLAAILSRGIITTVIRYFYNHPRPFDFYHFTPLISESGNSFPSGHMAFFFAIATTIFFMNKKWGLVFMLSTLLMGFGRIFAGVHWPLDILGGIILGFLSALAVHWLVRPYARRLEPVPIRKEETEETEA